jgi:hypothetical protein
MSDVENHSAQQVAKKGTYVSQPSPGAICLEHACLRSVSG